MLSLLKYSDSPGGSSSDIINDYLGCLLATVLVGRNAAATEHIGLLLTCNWGTPAGTTSRAALSFGGVRERRAS